MDQTLINTLSSCGHVTETWTSPDGSVILVLPYGGRILGLFAPASNRNFLWSHPALQSVESARDFYQSNEWHNSGGDRTWLSPEVDFFLPNFPLTDVYMQPRELDPGSFQLTRENGFITLTNRFSSKLSRSGHTVRFELSKCLKAARNPLRHSHPELAERLAYAGYSLCTRLKFMDKDTDHPRIGLWSLLQMPFGGELVIPTLSKLVIQTYMGHIDESDISVTNHLIRYRMRSAGEHKIGIPADAVIGRVGYFYTMDGESCLIIRNFSINPSGEYIDVPWHSTQQPGAAVEACNVNSRLGAFSELEYHVPAIGGPDGSASCEDNSQVWAFRGKEQDIREVGRILIAPDL
jgi:hypothetical protein